MNFSQTLLTELKAAYGGVTDYRAAKNLGVTPQTLSRVKCNHVQFSEETTIKIAHEIGVSPVEAVAMLHLETETSPLKRELWQQILDNHRIAQALDISGISEKGAA